jgi:DNA polymerase III epsilon subunit-like protein
MSILVIDTETTGLPTFTPSRGFYNPRRFDKYDSSRMASVSWNLLDEKTYETVSKSDYYIKPDGFDIPPESTQIHGITTEFAEQNGVPIRVVFDALMDLFNKYNVTTLVAHNLPFDLNVSVSECFRYGYDDVANIIQNLARFCTMIQGRNILKLSKRPKLAELYRELYNEDIVNAHTAEYDTLYCSKCYVALMQRLQQNQDTVSTNTKHQVSFSEEQMDVIHAPSSSNSLVMACAGSGKTTTIVQRIKYLITECSVDEGKIILTTFTNHAAAEMQDRLAKTIGHPPEALVGTFDSLSLIILGKHNKTTVGQTHSVSEYSSQLLCFLRDDPEGKSFLQDCCSHIFVDEFQDVNDIQFEIVKTMFTAGVHVTCVGDISQNIYTFRDSNIEYIQNFDHYFPGANVVTMRNNYRSNKQIVDLANAICTHHLPMQSYKGTDTNAEVPIVQFCDSVHRHNIEVVRIIKKKIKTYDEFQPCSIAVLCPHNRYLYPIRDMLSRQGIECTILDQHTNQHATSTSSYAPICLSTFHKAKGLEWDHVLLIMMHDDILPISKDDVEEGRRLLYVGVTRAKMSLHMLFAPIYNRARMTRYLSELSRTVNNVVAYKNCQSSHFMYRARDDRTSAKDGAAEKMFDINDVVSRMSSAHYTKLREAISVSSMPTHQCIPVYPPGCTINPHALQQVRNHHMQKYLSTFVKLVIENHLKHAMMLSSGGCCPAIKNMITDVKLDYEELAVKEKYAKHFEDTDTMRAIGSIVQGSNVFKKRQTVMQAFLQYHGAQINSEEMGIIVRILRKVQKHVRTCQSSNVQFEDIRFTPQFRQTSTSMSLRDLCEAFDRLQQGRASIADMDKLACAVCGGKSDRYRLEESFLECLVERVIHDFVDGYIIQRISPNTITMHVQTKSHPILVDVFARIQSRNTEMQDCLLEVIVPEHGHVTYESLVQHLCAKSIMEQQDEQHVHISHMIFFDPMNGATHIYDVRAFAEGNALIDTMSKIVSPTT